MEWSELEGLSQGSRDALSDLNFSHPTRVQYKTIPLFLNHKDVVAQAITGSGKTIAFLIPVIEILIKEKTPKGHIGAIILSPTRELAKQTGNVLEKLLKHFPSLTKSVVTGGESSIKENFDANIIIATPGRLEFSEFKASKLEVLIFDEADRLFSMGFRNSIQSILSRIPKQRRTGLFSATMNEDLEELVAAGLRNPVRVTIDQLYSTPDSLEIYHVILSYKERLSFLVSDIATKYDKVIVYFGTCASVDYFGKVLSSYSELFALALHGKMDHKKRTAVYSKFVNSKKSILLCTDLTARGLDFQDIDMVVQFDPPQDPASIIHRCGRTARSGRSGVALLMLDFNESPYVDFLRNRKMKITEWQLENKDPDPDIKDATVDSHSQRENLFDLHAINMSDRDFHDKSVRAFVSYIRHYREHYANFIFEFKSLDIQGLALAFGLFRIPKMPDLKLFNLRDIKLPWIDTDKISYKDDKREAARQVRMENKDKIINEKKPEKPIKPKVHKKQIKKHEFDDEDMKELEEDWKSYKKEKKTRVSKNKERRGPMETEDL